MVTSVGLSGRIRELLPLQAVIWMVRLSRSISVHLSFASSLIRAPVSLRVCRRTAVFIPEQ